MDSHAYRDFVEQYCATSRSSGTWWRQATVSSRRGSKVDTFTAALKYRRSTILDSPDYHLLRGTSTLPRLFRDLLNNLSKPPGDDPDTGYFRAMGAGLLQFLVTFTNNRDFTRRPNLCCRCSALLCFLTEALIFRGWCPNAFEHQAKWVAHRCFAIMKKNLGRQDDQVHDECAMWIHGAWLVAQTTEGIAETAAEPPSQPLSIHRWAHCTPPLSTFIYNSNKPSLHFFLHLYPDKPSHPHYTLHSPDSLGLSFETNGTPLKSMVAQSDEKLLLKNAVGIRRRFACTSQDGTEFTWTLALLAHEITIYRIDVIQTDSHLTLERPILKLEKPANAYPAAHPDLGTHLFAGQENLVVRFLENPFSFSPADSCEPTIAIFEGAEKVSFSGTLQSVVCWARGHEIGAVNLTRLLGIH